MSTETKHATLNEALAAAHLELKNPAKDRENPYFSSKYATLDALQDASRSVLARHGLTVTQTCHGEDPAIWRLTTTLRHISGESITSEMPLVACLKGPQQFGSELTYMRRYSYAAILSMAADEDDDANAAQGKTERKDPLQELTEKPKRAPRPTKQYTDSTGKPDGLPGVDPEPRTEPPVPAIEDLPIPEPEPTKDVAELTPYEAVRQQLKMAGHTEEQFMTLLRSFKLTRANQLDQVDDKVLVTVMGNWESCLKRMGEKK